MAVSRLNPVSGGIGNFALVGNTAGRPSSPTSGTTYFNTDASIWEVFSNGAWRGLLTTTEYVTGGQIFTNNGKCKCSK